MIWFAWVCFVVGWMILAAETRAIWREIIELQKRVRALEEKPTPKVFQ